MRRMARNETLIRARPADVFAVLTDPDAYGYWVVGSKEIRGVDKRWPRRGSRFHHTIGAGPVTLQDNSKVIDIKQDKRLVLEARFRPIGTAIIDLRLKPKSRGKATKVTMIEKAGRGPMRRVWNPAVEIGMRVRNRFALRRLKRLAEERARG
jgi:uncharacterized protein YndB with AHSA1/START domain